jgi:hypothetical protein
LKTLRIWLALGLTGVLFAATGCDPAPKDDGAAPAYTLGADSPSPSPTGPSAKDVFVAALRKTVAAPYRFSTDSTLDEGQSIKVGGVLDTTKKLLQTDTTVKGGTGAGTSHTILVGTDAYVRPDNTKRWVHLDLTRVKENSLAYINTTDPTGIAGFVESIGSVELKSEHEYSGKFNADNKNRFLPIGAPSIFTIGLTAAPFTATTDAQGNVVSLHIELEAKDKKYVMTTTFSEHGKALSTKKPAKSSVDEADNLYYQ